MLGAYLQPPRSARAAPWAVKRCFFAPGGHAARRRHDDVRHAAWRPGPEAGQAVPAGHRHAHQGVVVTAGPRAGRTFWFLRTVSFQYKTAAEATKLSTLNRQRPFSISVAFLQDHSLLNCPAERSRRHLPRHPVCQNGPYGSTRRSPAVAGRSASG